MSSGWVTSPTRQSSSVSPGRPRNSAIASLASVKRPSRANRAIPIGARSNTERKRSTASVRAPSARRTSVRSWQIPCRWPRPAGPRTIVPRKRTSRISPPGRRMRANESKSPPRSRAAMMCSVSGPRSSSTTRALSSSLVGTKCSGSSPKIRYISRDHVISSRPMSKSHEPSWANRCASASLLSARRRSVTSTQVPSSRRADPSGAIVAAARQCRILISPSRRQIRMSRSIGASPASAATVATRTRSRSSSWMRSCTLVGGGRLLGRDAVDAAELGRPLSPSVSTSQCQLPTPAICCASARLLSLRRRASSTRLRSVMSVEMPITATGLPSASNTGVLWVRCVRPPHPSSTSIGRPVRRTSRFCSAQRSTVAGSKSSDGSLPTTSSGGLPTSSQAARLACTIRPSGSCTYISIDTPSRTSSRRPAASVSRPSVLTIDRRYRKPSAPPLRRPTARAAGD